MDGGMAIWLHQSPPAFHPDIMWCQPTLPSCQGLGGRARWPVLGEGDACNWVTWPQRHCILGTAQQRMQEWMLGVALIASSAGAS